ncbi:MAG: ABC transporter permease [Acidobacteriota bacterium]
MLEGLVRDVRIAGRWLLGSRGFAAVAILSLGLGVGVNTAMFTLVDAVLLRPLPVERPDTLVDVFTTGSDGDEYATSSYPDFLDLQASNDVFSDMIAYSPMLAPLGLGDRSRLVMGQVVTSNHFEVLGIRALLGRTLEPADDAPGAARVVMLSHRLWTREFGADPAAVGQTLTLRGQAYAIVGVAPPSFTGVVPLIAPELWLPIAHVDDVEPAGIIDAIPGPGRTRLERRGARWLFVKGRLKPGVTAAQAHANVALLGTQLEAAHPQTNTRRRFSAVPTTDVRLLVPQASAPLAAGSAGLMAVVGLVLCIACANVAGLLLARASARRREIGVRLAVGATRGRLVQQLLVESLVLGLAGAALAVGVAWTLVQALASIELPIRDLPLDLRLDGRVLAFALGAAGLAGLLAGLTPALKASAPSLVDDLRADSPATAAGGRRWGMREALVGGQIALTAVLLVVAGLLLRSLDAARHADVGFDVRGLALLSFDTDMVRYPRERGQQFWQDLLARARQLPGIDAAALASARVPFDLNFTTNEITIDDRSYAADARGEIISNVAVSPEYFATLGVRIVDGRAFTDADREGAPRVAIVSEAMARRYWPDASAVGRTFTIAATRERVTIVGVSADYKVHTVMEAPTPYIHYAAAQRPSSYHYLLARTRGDAEQALAALRREALAMEPGLVFVGNATMERALALTLLPSRVGAMLAAGFGLLGTLLAAVGLYGVIAYAVARRTREIGLRIALGARPGQVLRMVMGQGFALAALGAIVGLGLAAVAARLLAGVVYGVGPADPVAWGSAVGALAAAAALANLVPARRAMRVDPVRALKAD